MASFRGLHNAWCCGMVLVLSGVAVAESKPTPELKGYCPASYLMDHKAVEGTPDHQLTHNGKLYYFATEKAKAAFQSDPEKYLPQFNGMCTVALGGMYGNRIAPDPEIFEIRDGKVYLFCADRARKLFVKDPDKYIPTAAQRFKEQPADAPVTELGPAPDRTASTADATPKPAKRPALDLIGAPIPAATFAVVAGEPFNPAEMKEDAAVLMFYASWCSACKKTLPKLNELAASYAGKPVRFIGVSQDTLVDQPDPSNRRAVTKDHVVSQWKELGVGFPLAFDPSSIGRVGFKVTSFPTLFLLGKNSKKVEGVYVGGGAVNSGKLKSDIDALLKPAVSQTGPGTAGVAASPK